MAKDAGQLKKTFVDFPVDPRMRERYNIAPTQPVSGWVADPETRLEIFSWGLVPPWAKDPAFGAKCINARAETAAEKPSFKTPFRRKRCLIPADGWYEWKKAAGGGKQPYRFRRRDHGAFVFGGLWEEWHDKEGGMILSCAILTCRANRMARKIHPRMPVVIREEDWRGWLDPLTPMRGLFRMLEPISGDDFTVEPVSRRVNRAGAEGKELIQPIDPPSTAVQGELF